MSFTNDQVLNLVNFRENPKGTESIATTTTTTTVSSSSGSTTTTTTTVADSYTISMTSAFIIPIDVVKVSCASPETLRFILPATVQESFDRSITVMNDGTKVFPSSLSDTARGEGVLVESLKNGAHLVATGQDSDRYIYSDPTGACFNHYIAAIQGFITADILSPHC
jgi:hypothetical protein